MQTQAEKNSVLCRILQLPVLTEGRGVDLASELPCSYVGFPAKAEKHTSQVLNSSTASQDTQEDSGGKMPFKDEQTEPRKFRIMNGSVVVLGDGLLAPSPVLPFPRGSSSKILARVLDLV